MFCCVLEKLFVVKQWFVTNWIRDMFRVTLKFYIDTINIQLSFLPIALNIFFFFFVILSSFNVTVRRGFTGLTSIWCAFNWNTLRNINETIELRSLPRTAIHKRKRNIEGIDMKPLFYVSATEISSANTDSWRIPEKRLIASQCLFL